MNGTEKANADGNAQVSDSVASNVNGPRQTRANIGRPAVLAAMAEFDAMGRDAFLTKHGYRKSNAYKVTHEGRAYDSKAILGVAFGHEYGCPALRPSEFSGGAEHCAKLFMRLGFTMRRGDETLTEKMVNAVVRIGRRVGKTVAAMVATVTTIIVGLVSCSKSKLTEAAPARELYSPSYVFSRSAQYVEAHCDEWFVLSAKHGLVHPDTVVEPYDETLSGAPKAVRDEWAEGVREALQARYAGRPVKFILMAGRSYSGAVEGLDAEVEQPMQGMGTGFRRQWLAANT